MDARYLSVQRVESVPAGARVRHVDQLDEPTPTGFLELFAGETPPSEPSAGLEAGEIVVFTDSFVVTTVRARLVSAGPELLESKPGTEPSSHGR